MSRSTLGPLSTVVRQLSSTTAARATVASIPSSSSSTSLPTSSTDRVYPARKAFLHAYYGHLLSTSELVLLFSHANLTVAELNKVRRALAKLPPPLPSPSASAIASSSGNAGVEAGEAESQAEPAKATLTITRTGLLSALFPKHPPSSSDAASSSSITSTQHPRAHLPSLQAHLTGPTALPT